MNRLFLKEAVKDFREYQHFCDSLKEKLSPRIVAFSQICRNYNVPIDVKSVFVPALNEIKEQVVRRFEIEPPDWYIQNNYFIYVASKKEFKDAYRIWCGQITHGLRDIKIRFPWFDAVSVLKCVLAIKLPEDKL